MNQSHFIQTGGFPMDVNVLDRMQKAYELFNKLGYMVGQFGIIEGCQIIGTTVGNGTIFIQGEVLEFRQAELGTTIIIVEEPLTAEFQGGAVHTIHTTRYATFGTGTTTYEWALFKTYPPLTEIQQLLDSKANQATVSVIQGQITALQAAVATIPKIIVTSGSNVINTSTGGQLQNDFTKNFYDVAPPSGYTMANLAGFVPSIAVMFWGGNVDGNDTTWCKYQVQTNKIRIICNNSESRESASVNYMAIWIKF
jgi:hypothetical protein